MSMIEKVAMSCLFFFIAVCASVFIGGIAWLTGLSWLLTALGG